MSDQSTTEILIRAKYLTQEAFAQAAADLKKVDVAAQAAGRSYSDFGTHVDRINGLVKQFAGGDTIQRAQQFATAVEAVGGASKLTESEQRRVNQAVTDAIAKYRSLGQEVPPHLTALANATKGAGDQTSFLSSTFGQMLSALSAASLINRAAGFLGSLAGDALASAGALVDLSNKTGLSTETLQRMQFAAKQSGSDVSQFADAAFKLGVNVSAGTAKVRAGAEALGISWQQLKDASPDEQFNTVVEALERMEDPQKRNEAAVALFGKTAKDILPTIVDGYSKVAKEADVAGDAQVRALDAAGDAWDRFKQRTTNALIQGVGSAILLHDAVAKLPEGYAQFLLDTDKSIKTTEDLNAALIRAASSAKDVKLPAETKAVPESFIESLKAAREGYENLTVAKRREIDAALQMNRSNDEIINQLGITDGVLSVAKKAYDDHKSAVQKAAEEAKKYADLVKEIYGATVPLTVAQRAQAIELEHLGVSTSKIAQFLGISEEPIAKFNEGLKETSKWLADIGKQVAQIPHNVPLHLQSETLSGIVPQLNVDAVKQASAAGGAIRMIADATYGDIEGRLRANGVFTRAELQRQADAAKRDYELMKASGKFTYEELAAAAQRSADAQRAALTGVAALWQHAKDALQANLAGLAGDLDSAIAGGGSISQAFANYGTNVAKNFTQSALAMIPGIGPILSQFAGPIVDGLKKMFGNIFGIGTAGRDTVQDYVTKNFGSFDALQKKLADLVAAGQLTAATADQMWRSLTQGVGRNDAKGAQAAIDAFTNALGKIPQTMAEQAAAAGYQTTAQLQQTAQQAVKVWQYMRESGEYSAAAIEQAFQQANAAVAASGDTSAQAIQTQLDTAKDALKQLDDQIASLQKSVDAEAPEAEMGAIETLERAKLEAMKKERDEAAKHVEDLQQQLIDAMNGVATAVSNLPTEWDLHIRTHYDDDGGPGGKPSTQHAAGAYIRQDHYAKVHAGEMIGDQQFFGVAIANALAAHGIRGGGAGDMHVTLQMPDGEVLTRQVVRRMGDQVRRYGIQRL